MIEGTRNLFACFAALAMAGLIGWMVRGHYAEQDVLNAQLVERSHCPSTVLGALAFGDAMGSGQ